MDLDIAKVAIPHMFWNDHGSDPVWRLVKKFSASRMGMIMRVAFPSSPFEKKQC